MEDTNTHTHIHKQIHVSLWNPLGMSINAFPVMKFLDFVWKTTHQFLSAPSMILPYTAHSGSDPYMGEWPPPTVPPEGQNAEATGPQNHGIGTLHRGSKSAGSFTPGIVMQDHNELRRLSAHRVQAVYSGMGSPLPHSRGSSHGHGDRTHSSHSASGKGHKVSRAHSLGSGSMSTSGGDSRKSSRQSSSTGAHSHTQHHSQHSQHKAERDPARVRQILTEAANNPAKPSTKKGSSSTRARTTTFFGERSSPTAFNLVDLMTTSMTQIPAPTLPSMMSTIPVASPLPSVPAAPTLPSMPELPPASQPSPPNTDTTPENNYASVPGNAANLRQNSDGVEQEGGEGDASLQQNQPSQPPLLKRMHSQEC